MPPERHQHTGTDQPRVRYIDVERAPNITVSITVKDTDAATAANYDAFWNAPYRAEVLTIQESHKTAGTDGGAVTLQIERRQGTEAKGAGDNLLATAFSLKATAETTQNGTLTTSASTLILERGDKLGLLTSGTLTAVAHALVTVQLRRLS